MTSKKTQRKCAEGHSYYKSSDCPTCPICETNRKPKEGFLSTLSAPARRALELHKIQTIEELAHYSKTDILQWHGIGPSTIPKLEKAMAEMGVQFKIKNH